MKFTYFAILFLATLTGTQSAIAEEASTGSSMQILDVSQNPTFAQNSTIDATNADGQHQTTVVDESGNLKIVGRPKENTSTAPTPSTTNPLAQPRPNPGPSIQRTPQTLSPQPITPGSAPLPQPLNPTSTMPGSGSAMPMPQGQAPLPMPQGQAPMPQGGGDAQPMSPNNSVGQMPLQNLAPTRSQPIMNNPTSNQMPQPMIQQPATMPQQPPMPNGASSLPTPNGDQGKLSY